MYRQKCKQKLCLNKREKALHTDQIYRNFDIFIVITTRWIVISFPGVTGMLKSVSKPIRYKYLLLVVLNAWRPVSGSQVCFRAGHDYYKVAVGQISTNQSWTICSSFMEQSWGLVSVRVQSLCMDMTQSWGFQKKEGDMTHDPMRTLPAYSGCNFNIHEVN